MWQILTKFFYVVLLYGNWFGAMVHSAEPNSAFLPVGHNQILCYGPWRKPKPCAFGP
jgi:hypothetical protein